MEILMPERFRAGHKGRRNAYFAHPRIRSMGAGIALIGLRKDGTEFRADISLSPLEPENCSIVVSAIRDVSDRS